MSFAPKLFAKVKKLQARNIVLLPFEYGALDGIMQVLSKGKKKRFSRACYKNFKKAHTYELCRTR